LKLDKTVKNKLIELGGDDWRAISLEEVTASINKYDTELFGDILADVEVDVIRETYNSIIESCER